MKWKLVFLTLFTLVFPRLDLAQAETHAHGKLSADEKKIVDTVLDEFKRHHMVYLEELSDAPLTIYGCTGISEAPSARGGKEHPPDHEHDEGYKEEHLAVRVIKATPAADGKFLTPTFTGPDRTGALSTWTYSKLYKVAIEGKKITVTMTMAEEGKPERQTGSPDKSFMDGLTARLQAKAGGEGVILLP